jgi:hypothetical protein
MMEEECLIRDVRAAQNDSEGLYSELDAHLIGATMDRMGK